MSERTPDPNLILALYAEGPARLEAALKGLSESDLDLALSPDSWTIRENAHHVVDGDDIWKTCIKAALGNGEGLFDLRWYWGKAQMAWAENWSYAKRSLETSLALFRANRGHIVELVRQTPDAWKKSVRIKTPQDGEARISVGEVLEMQAPHADEHIAEIQKILRKHNLV